MARARLPAHNQALRPQGTTTAGDDDRRGRRPQGTTTAGDDDITLDEVERTRI
jgi:hypothetical protein